MEPSVRAPGYDLFKLVIALLLLILFLFLATRQSPPSLTREATPLSPIETGFMMATIVNTITPPKVSATAVPNFPLTPTATPPPNSSPTAISQVSSTSTPTPPATGMEPTITAVARTPALVDVCEAATTRSRLHVGTNAIILRRLNFRSSPGIQDNWLLTNRPGTKVEVVDGPVCLPYYVSAYVWWQIKLPNGEIGWSAEASLLGNFYFMEPIQ